MNIVNPGRLFESLPNDAAAVLVRDGRILAAAEEERFTRKKLDNSFPEEAIAFCLEKGEIDVQDLTAVALGWDPRAHRLNKTLYLLRNLPLSIFLVARSGRRQWRIFRMASHFVEQTRYRGPIHPIRHHLTHAASAFSPSPFEEAAILTVDGVGEWETLWMGSGRGLSIKETTSVGWPHTLGGLYAAVTQHLGFEMFADEYKVMGLAAYARPVYLGRFREMIVLTEGGFRIDPSYFAYFVGWRIRAMGLMICSRKFDRELGPPRAAGDPVEERHADLAASLQARTEEVLIHFAREAVRRSGLRNLCLAGGVMLNSVAVGKIMESGIADSIFVPPCAGDAGASLGAALYVSHVMLGLKRAEAFQDARLGPEWGEEDIRRAVERASLRWTQADDPVALMVEALEAGQIVGWFQGRMEFGPRALGARSILADPRRDNMKDLVNVKVKFREPFRPFAPAIPEERFSDFFLGAPPFPFMTQVYQVREDKRHLIPAVTHIDGTARVQTVRRDVDPLFWRLFEAFGDRTGVPVLLNTSFNVKGEPIVNSPTDAVHCFLKAGLDLLVMGRFLARKRLAEGAPEEETAPLAFFPRGGAD